jgi:hypothetical protein
VEEAEMAEFYGPARRQIQDRFDTRRIADHFVDKIIGPAIREQDREFIVRVKATHVFPNCPRYIHKMAMVERSRFVPHVDCETPIPNWKLNNDRALLPKKDQETLAASEGQAR